MTLDALNLLLQAKEVETIEFKEAKETYSFDKLTEYCIAIANEGGGKFVLGITNAMPRRVVGTKAFGDIESLKNQLLNRVRLRVEVLGVDHEDGRVLVFEIPSRPVGVPLELNGRYLMRAGESVVGMTQEQIRKIHQETGPDYTSEICLGADFDSLDSGAIEVFRKRWYEKAQAKWITEKLQNELLESAELLMDGQVTYAALILLGTNKALGRYLAQSEVIYEYRNSDNQIEHSQRFEYREGFLLFHDLIWNQIAARNEVVSIREGLFRREFSALDENAVREAILNAVCHRDYRHIGSIYVRQYPKRFQIVSPGSLPPGINLDNIVRRQYPRNRRLAEACSKCGLVERSGQGMDRIYHWSLREGRGKPDFTGSDDYQVSLGLQGNIADTRFLGLLEIAADRNIDLTLEDLLVLEALRVAEQPTADECLRLPWLERIGLVERTGRGGSRRFILSRGLYVAIGEPAAYTRTLGLDRATKKALLLEHVRNSAPIGTTLSELCEVLPELVERQVRDLVYELRIEEKIQVKGRGKSARWLLPSYKRKIRLDVDNNAPGN